VHGPAYPGIAEKNVRTWTRPELKHAIAHLPRDGDLFLVDGDVRRVVAVQDSGARFVTIRSLPGNDDRCAPPFARRDTGFARNGLPTEIPEDHGPRFVSCRKAGVTNRAPGQPVTPARLGVAVRKNRLKPISTIERVYGKRDGVIAAGFARNGDRRPAAWKPAISVVAMRRSRRN